MKNIIQIVSVISFVLLASCTKWEYIDGGLANDKVQGPMLEYFRGDPYNWSYIDTMITRAGLEELFMGDDPEYQDFTFFGPTNHSIRKWIFDNEIGSVMNISVQDCRKYLIGHILKKRIMRDDIPRGLYSATAIDEVGEGGETYTLAGGHELWLHTFRGAYEDVPDVGAVEIRVLFVEKRVMTMVASSNIRCENGVVHSLSYQYKFPGFI